MTAKVKDRERERESGWSEDWWVKRVRERIKTGYKRAK